jgi:hypothetical protein
MRAFPALVGIAVLVATSAHASEDSGFYFGADAGVTRADTRKNNFDEALGVPSELSTLDDRDTTYGITAGYKVDSWLAVEASYLELGQVKYQVTEEPQTDQHLSVPHLNRPDLHFRRL